jgi:arginase
LPEYANFAFKIEDMTKKVTLLVNTSEITAGTRGASLGPEAIMMAAREKNDTFFSDHPLVFLPHENHLLDYPSNFPNAKRIDGFEKIFDHVMKGLNMVMHENQFPLVLAADHGSAAATIAGIRMQYPEQRLGVVWIDAHGDLHTPHTTPSGNMHGMPLALALSEDNLACKRNEIRGETHALWEILKAKGGEGPKFSHEDLFFIGVRDTEPEEEYLMKNWNIKNYTVAELRERKWEAISKEFSEWLAKIDVLYVSFDVDSMDPDLTSYGTGTPVKDGITAQEAKEILTFFASQKKLCCLEIVEVNPCLDDKNKMAKITFDLLKSTVETIEKN